MWRLSEKERRKYAQAERFGLIGRLCDVGWAGLSAKEAGRIGGSMHAGRKKTDPSTK